MNGENTNMDLIKIVHRSGGPELERIRISVYDLIPYLVCRLLPEYIASILPITIQEVQALSQYLEDHRDEVMAVHRQIEERHAKGNPPEIAERLRNLPNHQRIMARWQEVQAKRGSLRNGQSHSSR